MSLERNETARRFMEALLHAGEPQEIAKTVEIAVGCTDALLAALVPVAPATRTTGPVGHTTVVDADAPTGTGRPVAPDSGAPATEPRRTVGAVVRWRGQDHPDEEWLLVGNNKAVALKIRKPHLLDCGTNEDGGGDEFIRWATRAECAWHGIPYVARPLPGAPLAAPSPAATPAAWVPSVGDVVKQMTETDAVAEIGAIRVVVSTNPLRWVYVENGAKVGGACEPKGWEDEVRFVRRATSSERAAAGLPVDEAKESAVDRVALAKAIYAAVAASNPTLYGKPWDEAKDVTKRDAFNAADAAIAFMAKGGA